MKFTDFIKNKYEQITHYYFKAKEGIDTDNIEIALKYISKLKKLENKLSNYYLSSLYIDVGDITKNKEMILEGIKLIESDLMIF